MWGHLAAMCPRVSPEHAAISLPLRKQGKDETQRSILTFCEAIYEGAGFLGGHP